MASFRKSIKGLKRTFRGFLSPQFPSADEFAVKEPERFNIDPSRFLLPEPSFLTNLQEIDQPLIEAEQQMLAGLGGEEAEARRRVAESVAGGGGGRFGSPISAFDFAPLEQDILSRRSGIRGTFSQRRAEARQRAREQLMALRQGNLEMQRGVEEANVARRFGLETGQAEMALRLALAKLNAKIQKRRGIASLIGSGITAASMGGFGGGGGAATGAGTAAGAGAAMGGFTDIGFG